MAKNAKKNIKKMLTTEVIVEKYILLLLAIVAIVLGVLTITGILKFTDDKIMIFEPWLFSLFLIGIGLIALYISLKAIIEDAKLKKKVLKPVHQEIVDLYTTDKLVEKFSKYKLNLNKCNLNKDKTLMLIFDINNQFELYLDILDDSYVISFDYTTEFIDALSEEKKNKIDKLELEDERFEEISSVEYDMKNNTTIENIIEKIRVFIDNNLEEIKNRI